MLMLHCMCSLLFCGGRCLTTSPFPLSFRRLDPSERPLQILYDYLAAMGYADPVRVQHEAANSDLSCLIRFYSGEYSGLCGLQWVRCSKTISTHPLWILCLCVKVCVLSVKVFLWVKVTAVVV